MKDIILGMLNDAAECYSTDTKKYNELTDYAGLLLDKMQKDNKEQYLDIIQDIVSFDEEKKNRLKDLNFGFFKQELKKAKSLLDDVIKLASHKFTNGVVIVNTTPHPLFFEDSVTKELISIPSNNDILINAKAVETEVRPHFVKTVFEPNEDGYQKIEAIKKCLGKDVVIIGSMIAAQAYKGQVFGMTPVPGYERVAPAEKRMRDDKFVTYE